ncbi:hypothetical protein BDA96_02G374400 [Sorghum bicolor]|uniref:Uncharacterized protein n=2 Tax=Sorghum bicolor TaxID=4558 RepID=A0A921UXN8_SORBI|nr:hypothetical protein SORBI_3002G357200 [Sorghum bicolor]KAG0545591.1 hypothetical protein BDA96_02G374400 [Sorghum bicolor]
MVEASDLVSGRARATSLESLSTVRTEATSNQGRRARWSCTTATPTSPSTVRPEATSNWGWSARWMTAAPRRCEGWTGNPVESSRRRRVPPDSSLPLPTRSGNSA